ncbi:hypothetical protein GF351_02845 [Candidatus Woesearchaeota archaeon]|nr:hypothetical protein [Candidatus Woesearchaeota archaeon]
MPEIRFTITKKMDEVLRDICDRYGIDKSDYVRSLIVNDLRKNNDRTLQEGRPGKHKRGDAGSREQ